MNKKETISTHKKMRISHIKDEKTSRSKVIEVG